MALLDWAAGIAGAASDFLNYGNQVKALNWQKQAQETTWAREDNAVKRRVADLKAAGLNPVLAAGSSASTSSPITPIVPHMQVTGLDKAAAMQQLRNNRLQRDILQETKDLTNAQASKAGWESDIAATNAEIVAAQKKYAEQLALAQVNNLLTENELKRANIDQVNTNISEQLYNLKKAMDLGIRSDVKGTTSNILQGVESVVNAIRKLNPSIGDALGKLYGGNYALRK